MFARLEIETHSACNRKCTTCLRNSNPRKEEVADWFNQVRLPMKDIGRVVDEAIDFGFEGDVCISHFNEPLMDDRIVEVAKLVSNKGLKVVMCSNADFLTQDLAVQLDGVLESIVFAFYMEEPNKSRRIEWVKSLFAKTKLHCSRGEHIITHFQPHQLAATVSLPCHLPSERMIINHRGQMLMCCEDMVGRFDLGNIYDGRTIGQLWESDKHMYLLNRLINPGGRVCHSHCASCPRSG